MQAFRGWHTKDKLIFISTGTGYRYPFVELNSNNTLLQLYFSVYLQNVCFQSNLDYHRRRLRKQLIPHSWLLPLNLPYQVNQLKTLFPAAKCFQLKCQTVLQSFYVGLMYVLTKMLYLINSIFALILLNYMMLGDSELSFSKWFEVIFLRFAFEVLCNKLFFSDRFTK